MDFVGSQNEPYGLNFTRTYYSGSGYIDGPLGLGWTHNFAMNATLGHSSLLCLADTSVIAGAAAIVELFVANDLLSDLTRPHDKFVIASLSSQWLGENLQSQQNDRHQAEWSNRKRSNSAI